MKDPFTPFKVLVLAPLRGLEKDLWPREPISVNGTELDRIMEDLNLSLSIPLSPSLCPSEELTIYFRKIRDFHPDGIVENHPFLRNLLEARNFVKEAKIRGLSYRDVDKRLKEWPDLPMELRSKLITTQPPPVTSTSSSVENILKIVSLPGENVVSSGETQPFVSKMDLYLREILTNIFACEDLRRLESTWQGLQYFTKEGGVNGDLKLKIFPVSFETVEKALDRLMLNLIEDLPSLVVLDLPLDNTPRSIELFKKIALFSETLLVPTLTWITPHFFHVDTWDKIETFPFLPHQLEETAFAKWRQFRKDPSSKWVATLCNRFLNRYPYGPDNKPKTIYFEESQPLWLSPIWGAVSLIGKSVRSTGWPTQFTDGQKIRVEGLALRKIKGDRYLPTEAHFPEERIRQFVDIGIMPFISPMNKDMAFIPSEITVGGRSLKYQLFISRITQFLFWCKDHFEKDLDPAEIEKELYRAFSLLWERTGNFAPQRLEISVKKATSGQPAIARVIIQPSHRILPSGEEIEIELNW